MVLEHRANNAILTNGNFVNGALADIAITTHGSDWYWVCSEVSANLMLGTDSRRLFAPS